MATNMMYIQDFASHKLTSVFSSEQMDYKIALEYRVMHIHVVMP